MTALRGFVVARYFIAGGGCYGSYYVRQLERARALGKLVYDELVVVDKNPACPVAATLGSIRGARLEVSNWEDFGAQVWKHKKDWMNDHWVPTPIGPHILFHWIREALTSEGILVAPASYQGKLPQIPYARTIGAGTLVLSHAPGVCPTNCVEPKICPLTFDDRDWEMKDTVRTLIEKERANHGIAAVGVFVCQHHSHGVGTIPFQAIYEEAENLLSAFRKGAHRAAVATVSSCHGILDILERGKGVTQLSGAKVFHK